MKRRRLDLELIARGLAATPEAAQHLIDDGRVLVQGSMAVRPSTMVALADDIRLSQPRRFVSRGGEKLDAALDDLGVAVDGRRCLDAGTGSGGFTDCLLERGAGAVVAVDVGYGQFDWKLRADPRVLLVERTNLRLADPVALGAPFDLVVADLSFIGLGLVAGTLVRCAAPSADLVLLVKPQFEAPADEVGPGGVVRDPGVWRRAIEAVAGTLVGEGVGISGVVAARPRGARGNQEFFVHGRRDAPPLRPALLDAAVGSAR